MTSIVLADDHDVVRQGIRTLLRSDPELHIVGEARDGAEAVRVVQQFRPDVLIVDVVMPVMNGLEVTREISRLLPRTRTIVLSMRADEAAVVEALRNGAAAYVLKDARSDEILESIREVVAGRRYLSPPLSQRAIDAYLEKIASASLDPYDMLTARERQILRLAVEGYSNSEIAEAFSISTRTVETHRGNLMKKLGLRTQTDLVLFAVKRGLVTIE